jgi:hypothetical protein
MPRVGFVFLATAPKCAVLRVMFGLGMALVGFPELSRAKAQDWGIHEGVVEVSSSEVPKADQFDFLIVNSPTAILYAYVYDIDSRDGRTSFMYEFFDDRNPFGVIVDVSRPPGPITAPWSELDVIKTLQETPSAGSAGRTPPQALDRLALGLLGTYHALRIERRDQIAEGPSQSNPYFTSISLRGQLSALESFEIRQTRKDFLSKSNPKRLEDCLFDNQGTDTVGSIVTSVTFPKPVDFRTAGNSPPTITVLIASTEGRTRLKKYTVTKLAHRPSAEAADQFLRGFYQRLGDGRKIITESNVDLVCQNGVVMVAVGKGVEERISALSNYSKPNRWSGVLRLTMVIGIAAAVVASWFLYHRSRV